MDKLDSDAEGGSRQYFNWTQEGGAFVGTDLTGIGQKHSKYCLLFFFYPPHSITLAQKPLMIELFAQTVNC